MKVLLAPDSFKGSLSAPDAAVALASGWRRVFPDGDCVLLPVADGGEGTRDALISATKGSRIGEGKLYLTGPLGDVRRKADVAWGLLGDGETAVVELATIAGLPLVPEKRRDPKVTMTHGVGELLLSAIQNPSVKRVIIGLGGSATNDGGSGLLTALGLRFLDARGRPLPPGGAALNWLTKVDKSGLLIDPEAVEILIACDVDNPLIGPRGASAVFGPQKGATPEDIVALDAALENYAHVLGIDPMIPGSGAAGGTAAGLLYLFPKARLVPGIELVLEAIGFDRHLVNADFVVTGEGRLDGQTLGGKAVAGVARRAKRQNVPVIAFVGSLAPDVDLARLEVETGVSTVVPLVPGPVTLKDAMQHAATYLRDAAERTARLVRTRHGARHRGSTLG